MSGVRSRRVLEVSGVTKSTLQNHPLPEKADDVPEAFQDANNVSFDGWLAERCWSDTPDSHCDWFDSRSISSTSSWDDDVFEQQAAKRVQEMFDNIDTMLYEKEPLRGQSELLSEECQVWAKMYPHFRVVGKQVFQDEEKGYESFSPETPFVELLENHAISDLNNQGNYNSSSLTLRGKHLPVHLSSWENTSNSDSSFEQQPHELDEIFAQEGEYEELIAADYSLDSDQPHNNNRPESLKNDSPVLYKKSLSESIMDALCENMWDQVVSCMRPLLTTFSEHVLSGTSRKIATHNTAPPALTRGRLRSAIQKPSMVRLATAPSRPLRPQELNGVLSVSSKILQTRLPGSGVSSSSSSRTNFRPSPINDNFGSVIPIHNRMVSARRVRLSPLMRSSSCSKGSPISDFTDDEWQNSSPPSRPKTVKSIIMSKSRQSSALPSSSRLGRPITLPPIEIPDSHRQASRKQSQTAKGPRLGRSATIGRDILDASMDSRNSILSGLQNVEFNPRRNSLVSDRHSTQVTSARRSSLASMPPMTNKNMERHMLASLENNLLANQQRPVWENPLTLLQESSRPNLSPSCSSTELVGLQEENECDEGENDMNQESVGQAVEPFVTWLLSQVQANACNAIEKQKAKDLKSNPSV